MLMVRPVIKMNSWRKRKSHIMVFFIFMVSNMGGCLTPIGDPPLLMGFMRGVPFFWSLHLLPVLLFNMVIMLFVFYHVDKLAYRKDIAQGRKPDISKPGTEFHIDGLHNIIFLIMIVAAVILSGVLPGLSAFQDAEGAVKGIHLLGEVTLTFPALIEIVLILLAAFLSFKTTDKSVRRRNHFTWGAIQEVAVLFIGIFITMQPALMLLKAVGPNLGITKPSGNVLGDRCTVQFSGQYADLPCISHNGRNTWFYQRNRNDAWHCAGETAFCNFLWCGIHGREHLYRKCTELYGQVHF